MKRKSEARISKLETNSNGQNTNTNALNDFTLSLRAIPPWRESVAISPWNTRLRSLFRAKRGISEFASALPRNRFTPRNDTYLNGSG